MCSLYVRALCINGSTQQHNENDFFFGTPREQQGTKGAFSQMNIIFTVYCIHKRHFSLIFFRNRFKQFS